MTGIISRKFVQFSGEVFNTSASDLQPQIEASPCFMNTLAPARQSMERRPPHVLFSICRRRRQEDAFIDRREGMMHVMTSGLLKHSLNINYDVNKALR